MGLLTVNGIVTRLANYRDNDKILTIFTAEQGGISASARGCRKVGSKLFGAAELFVYGEFVLFEGKDKFAVDSCDVRESFYPLREDVSKLAAGAYMLSLVNQYHGTECAAEVLRLLYHALSYTAYAETAPVDMAICFAARFLAAIGFAPATTRCSCCGRDLRAEGELRFLPARGGAACSGCGGRRVQKLTLEALRRMLLLTDEQMKAVVLPEGVRAELKAAINEYAECVFEHRFKAIEQL